MLLNALMYAGFILTIWHIYHIIKGEAVQKFEVLFYEKGISTAKTYRADDVERVKSDENSERI